MEYVTLDDILEIRDQVSAAANDRFEVMSPNGLLSALAGDSGLVSLGKALPGELEFGAQGTSDTESGVGGMAALVVGWASEQCPGIAERLETGTTQK